MKGAKKMKSFYYLFALVLTSQAAIVMTCKADESLQKMTGIVQGVSKDKVQVQDELGRRILEIERNDKDSKVPKDIKAGDHITIWYKVDVEKIAIRKQSQQPGQAEPERLKPLQDDRIFYSAERSRNSDEINKSNG